MINGLSGEMDLADVMGCAEMLAMLGRAVPLSGWLPAVAEEVRRQDQTRDIERRLG